MCLVTAPRRSNDDQSDACRSNSAHTYTDVHVCVCVRECMCASVCACVCAQTHTHTRAHTHIHTYFYTPIYLSTYVHAHTNTHTHTHIYKYLAAGQPRPPAARAPTDPPHSRRESAYPKPVCRNSYVSACTCVPVKQANFVPRSRDRLPHSPPTLA